MLVQKPLLSRAAAQMRTPGTRDALLYGKDDRNSEQHSRLQNKNRFHTSGFNDFLGLPPLPGANDFSRRPAAHFPLWLVVF